MFDLIVVRAVFIFLLTATAFFLTPFRLSPPASSLFGLGLGLVAVALEMRLRHVSLKRLIGSVAGTAIAILGAFLVSFVIQRAFAGQPAAVSFLQAATLLILAYGGLAIG